MLQIITISPITNAVQGIIARRLVVEVDTTLRPHAMFFSTQYNGKISMIKVE